ncbi:MAG: histidinol-phosphatase [Planctomycetota bacterium]|nr:MAG: histidinol-phosphatase [Planctomycetota bacterium]
MDPVAQRLQLALSASAEAAAVIRRYFLRGDMDVEHKADMSPVTAADREAEALLRERIEAAFPDDGIVGEEFGEKPGSSGYTWILDPLDGTKSFIHGVPLFGTLVGIRRGDDLVAGVCRFPALDEVIWAGRGGGAWWQVGNGLPRAARVSVVDRLADATFCTTTFTGWREAGRRAAFEALAERCGLVRGWGDCYGHMLVATGRAELMIDPLLNAWDAAALVPIVEEAGGAFVSLDGRRTIDAGNGLSVNAALKDDVLAVLAAHPAVDTPPP